MSDCDHSNAIEDYSTGTIVCPSCAHVLDSVLICDNFYFKSQPQSQSQLQDRIFERNYADKTASSQSLSICRKLIAEIRNVAEIMNVKEDAQMLAIKIFKKKYNFVKEKRKLAQAALFFSMKQLDYKTSDKTFELYFNVRTKDFKNIYRSIRSEYGFQADKKSRKSNLILQESEIEFNENECEKPSFLKVAQILNKDKSEQFKTRRLESKIEKEQYLSLYETYLSFFTEFKIKYIHRDNILFKNNNILKDILKTVVFLKKDILFSDKTVKSCFAAVFFLDERIKEELKKNPKIERNILEEMIGISLTTFKNTKKIIEDNFSDIFRK